MAKHLEQHDDEALRKLLQASGPDAIPSAQWQENLLAQLKARLDAKSTQPENEVRRHLKLRWVFRAAIAAAAAVLLGVSVYFLLDRSVPTAYAGFSEVLKRVRDATSVSFEQVLRVDGKPEQRFEVFMVNSGQTRAVGPDGRISITDHVTKRCLKLSPDKNLAAVLAIQSNEAPDGPLENLRRIDASAGRFVGHENLGDRTTDVYEVVDQQSSMKVWVDPKREFPVRIEVIPQMPQGQKVVVVLESFRWNEPLEASLFSLDIPAGYRLESPMSQPSEESVIDLLRMCAEMGGGRFPSNVDSRTVIDLVFKSHPQEAGIHVSVGDVPGIIASNQDDGPAKAAVKACLPGLTFVSQMRETDNWLYVGSGVTLGDATSPVCAWRAPDRPTWRVVYGNLKISDVTDEEFRDIRKSREN